MGHHWREGVNVFFFSLQVSLKVLIDQLVASRTALKSPEIFLILLTCPLLQEDTSVMDVVLKLAFVINDLNKKSLESLGK